ncbi:MAG TPA: Spy/CpxP family protein refolding chaperone [Fimbriimonadaceae bacterium]|nr:Spy/CpxP family protein refolding chaperone [Fimbriimonadaceae bacterium]
MNNRLSTVLVIVASVALASTSLAQRGGFRGGQDGQRRGGFDMGRMMNSHAALLRRPDVQKDIKLSDQQKTDLEKVRNDMMEQMRAMFSSGQSGAGGGTNGGGTSGGGDNGASGTRSGRTFDRSKIEEMQKEAETKVDAILTPDQKKRLDQIRIQLAGPRIVVDDEEIGKQLGMKARQKIDINKLIQDESDANRQIFMKMRDSTNAERDAFMAEIHKNDELLKTEINKILTPEQQKSLADMQGPKFEADPNYRPSFGGRGGGGGGGRGGGA